VIPAGSPGAGSNAAGLDIGCPLSELIIASVLATNAGNRERERECGQRGRRAVWGERPYSHSSTSWPSVAVGCGALSGVGARGHRHVWLSMCAC
jgi:hypothetical protein